MRKKYITLINLILISFSIFSQNIDTLALYNKSIDILKLYKQENSNELLNVYRSSAGPKYIKIEWIKRDIENYNTKNLNTLYFHIDSVEIEIKNDTILASENSKKMYTQEVHLKFKFPITPSDIKNNYFYYIIAYSKWWYYDNTEPSEYNLYFLNFENN